MEALIQEFLAVGSGDGSGDGDGYGYGDGYGSGYGSGDGSGYGSGDGIKIFDGRSVHAVDGTATVFYRIKGNVARGAILNRDLTLTPCWVMKQGGVFAHGLTLHKAQEALMEKIMECAPLEERVADFVQKHTAGKLYPNTDFFSWHHILTGSCEAGREQFARDHEIDVAAGSMTPEAFIALTEHAYGWRIIQQLKPYYSLP